MNLVRLTLNFSLVGQVSAITCKNFVFFLKVKEEIPRIVFNLANDCWVFNTEKHSIFRLIYLHTDRYNRDENSPLLSGKPLFLSLLRPFLRSVQIR